MHHREQGLRARASHRVHSVLGYSGVVVRKTTAGLAATALFSWVLAGCGGPVAEPAEHDVVIRHATIVDVETGELRPSQTMAIDGSVITSIEEDDAGEEWVGRIEVDATGRYAMPGLWDMHVHIEGADLVEDNLLLFPVYLAHGVTTVRDMASDLGEQVLEWRDEIHEGRLVGPRIFTAGRKIEGINSIWKDDLEVATEAEMVAMMDRLDAYEVDLVKVTENTLGAELFLATVREGRKRGYRVSGHVPYDATVEDVATSGLSSIEHASHMIRLGNADERDIASSISRGDMSRSDALAHYTSGFDPDQARRGYAMLAENDVFVTPTLIGGYQMAYLDENDHEADAFRSYLTEAFMSPYAARAERVASRTPDEWRMAKENYQRIAAQLPRLWEAGVTILGGSDSAPIAAFVYPGLALHEELQLFQEAGLTPLQALQSVTIHGARFLNQTDASGTLAVDQRADIVLLRSNPLEDIAATLSIDAVVSAGRVFDRTELDTMLDDAARGARALDASRAESDGREYAQPDRLR